MKYGVHYAGPRRGRREWGATVLTLLTLLALAALAGWLLHVLRSAAQGTVLTALVAQQQGYFLAMAPVPAKGDGAVLAVVLLGMAAVIWLSVLAERKMERREQWKRETRLTEIDQETEDRWRRVRRKQREILQRRALASVPRESWTMGPLESLSEAETEIIERLPKPPVEDDGDLRWEAVTAEGKNGGEGNDDFPVSPSHSLPVSKSQSLPVSQSLGLPLEDLRRIVSALVVETCSARDFLTKMERSLDEHDREDMLRSAVASLHQCIGCLGGLHEALQTDGERAKARTTNEEWPEVAAREDAS